MAFRMVLLVFILASAAFLSAITAMRIAIHGREVSMPNLVGKNVGRREQELRSRGLVLRVADRVYSEQAIQHRCAANAVTWLADEGFRNKRTWC